MKLPSPRRNDERRTRCSLWSANKDPFLLASQSWPGDVSSQPPPVTLKRWSSKRQRFVVAPGSLDMTPDFLPPLAFRGHATLPQGVGQDRVPGTDFLERLGYESGPGETTPNDPIRRP